MNDANTTTKPGVLAERATMCKRFVACAIHSGSDKEFAEGACESFDEARATVEWLIAADEKYDAALAAFNNTAATRPDWPQFHARFEEAKAQRAAALAAFNGEQS